MSESELDKKRNKLGYQRISIACAHCRRRKIRCLIAEDDSEQRCQNCIRLKKECVFYPVDQQAVIDARSESSSKSRAPSAPPSAVSTSPTQQSARGFEHHGYTGQYPAPSVPPVSTSFQGIPVVPASGMPIQANYSPQAYNMQTPSDHPSSQWSPADYSGHNRQAPMISRTPSAQPPFARFPPSQAADVAPYPGPEQPGQASSNVPHAQYGYGSQQMQQPPPNWQSQGQPGRAISYSEYPPNYAQYPQASTLSSSYSRQPILQPPMTAMMPVQHTVAPHNPQQYGPPHDPRSTNMPGPPQPHYQPSQQMPWFGSAPSPVDESVRRLPSNYPPPGYGDRPS
ncbi:putative zn(2)-C6 fungal-type DNA-binding domain-containing protein [Septoria linicola]|nr:putative zn(2)-C6 fungal-type DNA-binding domain-containing protein [Septoria linicola]